MKIGVIRFPGTNCDRDVAQAIELAGLTPEYIWWNEEKLTDFDGIVIPGGFSYGDYLRAGAMASITPVIDGIKELVKEEKPQVHLVSSPYSTVTLDPIIDHTPR